MQQSSILDKRYTCELTPTPPNLTAPLTLSNLLAALKISQTHTRHIHLPLTLISTFLLTAIATMASRIITPMRSSALPPPSLLYRSRCHRQIELPPLQHHHHQPGETLHLERVLLLRRRNQSFVAPLMERRAIRKSEWVVGVDRCYRNSGSKQVRLGSCEHVSDASSSRRLAIRVSHAPVANHHTPDFGRFLVLALTSKTLAIL
jgi:hypothetical protein